MIISVLCDKAFLLSHMNLYFLIKESGEYILELLALNWDLVYVSHFSSGTQSCLTLCNPMNLSAPGLSVHYQLLGSTQTHLH